MRIRRRTSEERAEFAAAAAARMAAQPTSAEALLWTRLEPLGFERQVPIAGETKNGGCWNYICDFLCHYRVQGWLCVEVDGGVHNRTRGHDRRRDTRLATRNIRTFRVKNRDVLTNLDSVVSLITAEMGK